VAGEAFRLSRYGAIRRYFRFLWKGDTPMAVPDNVKQMWIKTQEKHDHPVNAIGVKIDARDTATMQVWRDEGIDRFMKR
jgi:hypothetical protein